MVTAASLFASLLLLLLSPAVATAAEINSAGPLTRIIVSTTLNCQVAHRDDAAFELYPGFSEIGACGTFLATGDSIYGPSSVPSGISPTPWTPISQSPVAGSGTAGDPLRIVTLVEAPATGLTAEQTDSYVIGSQSYRTDIEISNAGTTARDAILYRAGDCYLQESDIGYGRVDGGAPACIIDPAEGSRIEQWLPVTAGSQYFEGGFGELWTLIASRQLLPNTCRCDEQVDNAAGLSWPLTVPAGGSVTISHETFFSPVGRAPAQPALRESVPGPTGISLDPIVVAQSAAITAGVILLVPFPSALFNSTLEENYDEVMAGVARVRRWLAAAGAALMAAIRRQIAARRNAPAPAGVDAADAEPPAAPEQLPGPAAEPASSPAETGAVKRDPWRTPQGIVGFVLASALLYAFLDPTFGFSLESLATLGGLAVGLVLVLIAYGLPLVVMARSQRFGLTVRALPATLLVAVVCVLVSRLTSFEPGYLYGLIIGFFFARNVDLRQEGRTEAVAAAASLAVALVAWIGLAFLRGGAADQGSLGAILVETAAVTTVVAGLENAVFALLPLRFLPGAAVFAWNRRVWAVLIALGIFGFAHVLLNPSAGYLADTTRTSFLTLVALLAAFGLASVLFWAWFRFRPRPAAAGGSLGGE